MQREEDREKPFFFLFLKFPPAEMLLSGSAGEKCLPLSKLWRLDKTQGGTALFTMSHV